jgi:tryptophanyl-tRNA synthetase
VTSVLSGIQPTGAPHLGNYLGALRWWVDLQDDHDAYYCVVDLHALTVPGGDPEELRQSTLSMTALLLAIGLDPQRCVLFAQSHVPEHTQLAWLLECTASVGEMSRMTQFKDKTAREGEEAARVGLFTYPVLMAADILLYQADFVPVGDDQRQHLELTRNLAERWNARFGATFRIPSAAIPPAGGGARIMDLQEPTRKMSKSADSHAGVVFLFDPPEVVERKIRRAVTDTESGPDAVRWDRVGKPGVSNLLELLAAATGRSVEEAARGYDRYGPLKADTAAAVVAMLEPIQARYRAIAADEGTLHQILRQGAERARDAAEPTLRRASAAAGLLAVSPGAACGPAVLSDDGRHS